MERKLSLQPGEEGAHLASQTMKEQISCDKTTKEPKHMLQQIYFYNYVHLQNNFDIFMTKICLVKDETNTCYTHAVGILDKPDVQLLDMLESDLELRRPWRRSYL